MPSYRFPLSSDLNDRLIALLDLVQTKDEAAFRELHDIAHPRVSLMVRRTLPMPEQAAEVVQELFLHVWQHADTFDKRRATVLGWLSVLAHRRAVDRVRRVARSTARDDRYAGSRLSEDGDVVAELGLARLEAAHVHAALGQLDQRYRNALVLTFLEGHTNAQAACLLAIPLGTLKTHVRVGLTKLREHLTPLTQGPFTEQHRPARTVETRNRPGELRTLVGNALGATVGPCASQDSRLSTTVDAAGWTAGERKLTVAGGRGGCGSRPGDDDTDVGVTNDMRAGREGVDSGACHMTDTRRSRDVGRRLTAFGQYRWDIQRDRWAWSHGMFRLHGYTGPAIVPTTALLLSHKDTSGRGRAVDIVNRVGRGPSSYVNYHRIVDAAGRRRTVLSLGASVRTAEGGLVVSGFMADLTEVERSAGTALPAAASEGQTAINQAQRAVMAVFGLNAEAALAMLIWYARNQHVELNTLCRSLVTSLARIEPANQREELTGLFLHAGETRCRHTGEGSQEM